MQFKGTFNMKRTIKMTKTNSVQQPMVVCIFDINVLCLADVTAGL